MEIFSKNPPMRMNSSDALPDGTSAETETPHTWHGVPIIESNNPALFVPEMSGIYITRGASLLLKRAEDARFLTADIEKMVNERVSSGKAVDFIVIDGVTIDGGNHSISTQVQFYQENTSGSGVYLGPENRPPKIPVFTRVLKKTFAARTRRNEAVVRILSPE